jgi:hypothetical protein
VRASWRIFAKLSLTSIAGLPTPASSVPAERAVCAVQGAMLCGSGRETPRSCDLAWLPFCHTGPASKLVRQTGRLMEFVAAAILQYTSHRREYVSPFLLAISDPRSSRHVTALARGPRCTRWCVKAAPCVTARHHETTAPLVWPPFPRRLHSRGMSPTHRHTTPRV